MFEDNTNIFEDGAELEHPLYPIQLNDKNHSSQLHIVQLIQKLNTRICERKVDFFFTLVSGFNIENFYQKINLLLTIKDI